MKKFINLQTKLVLLEDIKKINFDTILNVSSGLVEDSVKFLMDDGEMIELRVSHLSEILFDYMADLLCSEDVISIARTIHDAFEAQSQVEEETNE